MTTHADPIATESTWITEYDDSFKRNRLKKQHQQPSSSLNLKSASESTISKVVNNNQDMKTTTSGNHSYDDNDINNDMNHDYNNNDNNELEATETKLRRRINRNNPRTLRSQSDSNLPLVSFDHQNKSNSNNNNSKYDDHEHENEYESLYQNDDNNNNNNNNKQNKNNKSEQQEQVPVHHDDPLITEYSDNYASPLLKQKQLSSSSLLHQSSPAAGVVTKNKETPIGAGVEIIIPRSSRKLSKNALKVTDPMGTATASLKADKSSENPLNETISRSVRKRQPPPKVYERVKVQPTLMNDLPTKTLRDHHGQDILLSETQRQFKWPKPVAMPFSHTNKSNTSSSSFLEDSLNKPLVKTKTTTPSKAKPPTPSSVGGTLAVGLKKMHQQHSPNSVITDGSTPVKKNTYK